MIELETNEEFIGSYNNGIPVVIKYHDKGIDFYRRVDNEINHNEYLGIGNRNGISKNYKLKTYGVRGFAEKDF